MAAAAGLPGDDPPFTFHEDGVFIADDVEKVNACLSPPEAYASRLRAMNVDSVLVTMRTSGLHHLSAQWHLTNTMKASRVVDSKPEIRETHLQVRAKLLSVPFQYLLLSYRASHTKEFGYIRLPFYF